MISWTGNNIINICFRRNILRWGWTGQSHCQYRLWKKHLELGVVSPPLPGAGVWTQLPGLPDRLALGACRSWWGSYHWWLEGSPPMYLLLLTLWTWRRSWVVSCRAAPLQRNIDETKRTPLTSSVMPGTVLLVSDRYSILASGRLPRMFLASSCTPKTTVHLGISSQRFARTAALASLHHWTESGVVSASQPGAFQCIPHRDEAGNLGYRDKW